MRYDTPLTPQGAEISKLPVRQQLRQGFREMGRASVSSGKNFGLIGAVFSGTECCIEGVSLPHPPSPLNVTSPLCLLSTHRLPPSNWTRDPMAWRVLMMCVRSSARPMTSITALRPAASRAVHSESRPARRRPHSGAPGSRRSVQRLTGTCGCRRTRGVGRWCEWSEPMAVEW